MSQETPVVHVVEDDAGVATLIRRLLELSGYEVITHGEPQRFLEQFRARHPQCVLVDLRLPRMSGLELQRRLSELPDPPPVIVMTAYGTVQSVARAFRQGALDFIEKPFEAEVLLDSVGRALERDRDAQNASLERSRACQKLEALSARELEVFERIVHGSSSKVIAFELGLSKKTVDLHRGNVMRKLAASSLVDLVRLELATGRRVPSAPCAARERAPALPSSAADPAPTDRVPGIRTR